MSLRYYANAPATTLSSSCNSSATSIVVNSATGYPIQFPFTVIIDRGTATEEAVSVTAASGTTWTVTRAIDGTTAFAHSIGATVEHGITAQDIRESNTHVNTSGAVHGVTGSLVGTTDTQTLTNKTIGVLSNIINGLAASKFAVSDGSGKLVAGASNIPAGAVVGDTDAQTLSSKTINLSNNTVTGTTAQFNTALSDNDFATLAGTETLTNKTLTSPTVTSPTVNSPTVTNLTLDGVNISGAWIAYTPTATNFTVGNGTLTGRWMQIGKTVHLRITFGAGSTTTYSASQVTISLPVAAHATGIQVLPLRMASVGGHYIASATILAGGSVANLEVQTSATNCTLVSMTSSTPNPGTTGWVVIEGIYEVA